MTLEQSKHTSYRRLVSLPAVVAAVTLNLYNRFVRCTANTATDNYSITLPPVAEAVGIIISIHATSIANSKAVTVQDQDDSQDWSDLTIDVTADGVLLFSDGLKWWQLTNDIAA